MVCKEFGNTAPAKRYNISEYIHTAHPILNFDVEQCYNHRVWGIHYQNDGDARRSIYWKKNVDWYRLGC